MKGLTPKQREILNYIHDYIGQYSYSPTYREIMTHFSLSSPGSVYKHIQTLKRKGALLSEDKCSRSLIPVEEAISPNVSKEIALPFIGNISAGYPIETFAQPQTLIVPSLLVSEVDNTYILQVQGDSLKDEMMADGDLLIVAAGIDVEAGDLIIGLINQHDTVVRKYYPEGQYIRLEGINNDPLILRAEAINIQGIVIGLIRNY